MLTTLLHKMLLLGRFLTALSDVVVFCFRLFLCSFFASRRCFFLFLLEGKGGREGGDASLLSNNFLHCRKYSELRAQRCITNYY